MQNIEPENLLEPLTISLDHNTYNMKLQFIKKYSGRVCEGTIHFKITLKKKEKKINVIHIKKKKKSRTQRKSIIYKRK